jgi:hypothetical protein
LRSLGDIRVQGYATTTRTRRLVEEISLSAPVMAGDRVLAAVSVRFVSTAVPLRTGIERFLPKLHRCAATIGGYLTQQSHGVAVTP